MIATSRTLSPPRASTARSPLGRYSPVRITEHSRWRFFRHRRDELLRRIGGTPTERQGLAIEMLVQAEWAVTVAEHDAGAATDPRTRIDAMRVAGDARKQVLLWDRALVSATPPQVAERPEDPMSRFQAAVAARQRSPQVAS